MHVGCHSNMEGVWSGCCLLRHRGPRGRHWRRSWHWLGDSATLCSGAPFLVSLLLSLFRTVKQPLELFLQRLSALTPEVSFLLAIVTTVVSSFSVVCHLDGSCIDLSVEGQLHIISVLWVIVIINVRRDVVLFDFNFHGRLHLCDMDGDVGTIVVLPVVACLILMTIIRPTLVWICVVSSVWGLAPRQGVCLSILRPSAATVLSFNLFTLCTVMSR